MKDYDVYKLGQILDTDLQELNMKVTQEIKAEQQPNYLNFIEELKKKIGNKDKIEKKIQTILTKAKEGDLAFFKKKLGSDILKE